MPSNADHYRRRNAARIEDLEFLVAHHEVPEAAARRLGMTVDNLARWSHRHAPHLWTQLVANQQQPGHLHSGRATQAIS